MGSCEHCDRQGQECSYEVWDKCDPCDNNGEVCWPLIDIESLMLATREWRDLSRDLDSLRARLMTTNSELQSLAQQFAQHKDSPNNTSSDADKNVLIQLREKGKTLKTSFDLGKESYEQLRKALQERGEREEELKDELAESILERFEQECDRCVKLNLQQTCTFPETLRNRWYRRSSFKPHIHFHHANYCDQEQMRSILSRYEQIKFAPYIKSVSRSRIVAVFHFAASKAVEESFQKPLEYYSNNVGGLIEFSKTLKQYAIRTVVFSSSATVYGASRNGSVDSARFVESNCTMDSCQSLTSPYSRTKWMSEAILSDLAASDSSWTIVALRYFNPVGCDESGLLGDEPVGPPSNLMPHVVKALADESETVRIFGTDWETPDGTAIRDYIHISDLAEGHVKALHAIKRKTLRSGYHVFNLGTGTGHSVREIVSTMEEVSGRKISVSEDDRREGDACACIADPSRAASVLDWAPQRSVAKACEDICRRLSLSQWMRRKSSSASIAKYEKMV